MFLCETFIYLNEETHCEVTQTEANHWLFQKDKNVKEEKKRANIKRRLYVSLNEYFGQILKTDRETRVVT